MTTGPVQRSATTVTGRRIAWCEHGPPDGVPVLYCHGSPGAPAEVEQFHGDELAWGLGIRLVVVARPGMWCSDFQPDRTIVNWCEDAQVVADASSFDEFGIVGYSAGAAYAAAVATSMPHRVTAVSLVAPVDHENSYLSARLDRPSRWAERQPLERPRLTRGVMSLVWHSRVWRPALRFTLRYTPLLRRPDHLALRDHTVLESIVRKADQAFVGGVRGTQHDMALMMQPWGFDVGGISAPVHIWQGTVDTLGSTVEMARSLHQRVPGSTLVLVDEGHLSTMTNHATEIFAAARARAVGTRRRHG